MKAIKNLIDHIDDELCGATEYAEQYLTYKAKTSMPNSSKYAEYYKVMANDELKHAMYIHEICVNEIDELSKVYTAPVEMMEEWEKSHKKYIEKAAWIKQMLSM